MSSSEINSNIQDQDDQDQGGIFGMFMGWKEDDITILRNRYGVCFLFPVSCQTDFHFAIMFVLFLKSLLFSDFFLN